MSVEVLSIPFELSWNWIIGTLITLIAATAAAISVAYKIFESNTDDKLVEGALTNWEKHGTAENYLKGQYIKLRKNWFCKWRWNLERLDKIHEMATQRKKGRPPKQKISDILKTQGIS